MSLQDVRTIKYVLNVRVTWEKYRNTKKVTQCHRCQQFGHGSKNCCNAPRCMHCAAQHLTEDCTQKEEEPVCINCKKKHKANSFECEAYTKRLNTIAENRQKRSAQAIPKSRP